MTKRKFKNETSLWIYSQPLLQTVILFTVNHLSSANPRLCIPAAHWYKKTIYMTCLLK